LAKRLTDKQKDEIKTLFVNGEEIDSLKKKFDVSKLTIVRNLKKLLGDKEYKAFLKKDRKYINRKGPNEEVMIDIESYESNNTLKLKQEIPTHEISNNYFYVDQPLIEITPLIEEVNSERQKDISSIPIASMSFPKIVYMKVDKNFELEIKLLKDYLDWTFLPKDELNRKTIEVFKDIKKAKINCNKDQKVINVPNTNVFKVAKKILLVKGITRIVCGEDLIAL
tara:strand:+ start:797 stop:1468 length:672 start_codon:yes stop_codon:yes gene_type:complete